MCILSGDQLFFPVENYMCVFLQSGHRWKQEIFVLLLVHWLFDPAPLKVVGIVKLSSRQHGFYAEKIRLGRLQQDRLEDELSE